MTRAVIAALVLLGCTAPTAAAAGWSRPAGFEIGAAHLDVAPRGAVAPDGSSVIAWNQGRDVVAVLGDRAARYRRVHRLGLWRRVPAAVAAGNDGAALVAWSAPDGLRIAIRRHAGIPLRVRVLDATVRPDALEAGWDARGGWRVLATTVGRALRGYTLRADGTLALRPYALGTGSFGFDARPVQALAVGPRGSAAAVATTGESPTRAAVVIGVHHGRATQLADRPLPADGLLADPRVSAVDDLGGGFITATRVARCGDAGCAGQPLAWRLTGNGEVRALPVAAVTHPSRAFGPSIAPLGPFGAALVYQEKAAPAAFESRAPVKAVTWDGVGPDPRPTVTLTTGLAKEPVVVALTGGRALVVWSGGRGWGASLASPDGAWRRVTSPPGPPPLPFHSNPTNRDVAVAGRFVLVVWERDGRVRLSRRGF